MFHGRNVSAFDFHRLLAEERAQVFGDIIYMDVYLLICSIEMLSGLFVNFSARPLISLPRWSILPSACMRHVEEKICRLYKQSSGMENYLSIPLTDFDPYSLF